MEGDAHWMQRALGQARLAIQRGDVPIGAVIVHEGEIIGAGHDSKEGTHDPTAHAEIMAMRQAASHYGDWRLEGSTLYVTLEPCPMCAGAIIQARVARLVFGAPNKRWGAAGGTVDLLKPGLFNHDVEVVAGVLEEECAALLRATFRSWRLARSTTKTPMEEPTR
ncbi:MAG: nucleoside deaminase [Candidatus Sumerlaeia bacterium]|nr:nucleoside deaminase [Candidatus Sumerlaeia bacterium]